MLSVRCLSVCSVCPACDVRALWPNGWMDQDATWHAGRPRLRSHCVRWGMGTHLPPTEWGSSAPTFEIYGHRLSCIPIIRGPYLLWPNGWMDQDVIWYRGRPQPRPHCVVLDGDPCSSPTKGHSSPHFSAISIVAKLSPISATAELSALVNIGSRFSREQHLLFITPYPFNDQLSERSFNTEMRKHTHMTSIFISPCMAAQLYIVLIYLQPHKIQSINQNNSSFISL